MKKITKYISRYLKEKNVNIKAGVLAAVSIICTAGFYIADNAGNVMTNTTGESVIKRGGTDQDAVYNMKVRIGESGEERKIQIPVRGRAYAPSEIQQVFTDAGEELERLILGQNENLDEVRKDLELISEIPKTGIRVSWELDNYEVMDIQGNLQKDALKDSGTQVKLTAVLSYGEEQAVCEFYANVFPPLRNAEERLLEEIREEAALSDEKTKTEEFLVLPKYVDGKEIQWEYETNTRAFAVLILGMGAACLIIVSASQKKKEEEKKIVRQMKMDYPQIINKFNLYIRAGMTIRKAWFCIVSDYEKKYQGKDEKHKRRAYEEMTAAMYQIRGGLPEGEAYENYGIRCGLPIYRKFGSMLSQNLRKGSKGLTDLLGREAEEAFEERKNLAKKLGEEASTKLVIPLFLMLMIVFAIVIVPAFFSIQI